MLTDRLRTAAFLSLALTLAVACAEPEAPPATLDELAAQSLAQIEGEIEVPGLTAPVEVIRDEWGIPHIYADNEDDLFFAQGFVMAQDRLWQMEMWRRWREGRLAEIFGPEALEYDERTRLMKFRGPFDENEWTSYHPDAERLFTSYASGVNAFIEQNADNLPVEFKLTGIRPDPWTAETVVLRWAQIGLASVRGHAIHEIGLAEDVAELGAEEANRRAAPDPWDDLTVPEGLDLSLLPEDLGQVARRGDGDPFTGALPDLEIVEEYRHLVSDMQVAQVSPEYEDPEGSNNWVVSGEFSATGLPIMANDPHRRIELPALRYFIHLNAPGWSLIGGGEPPFVGTMAGNNENVAWGFTYAGTDMVDLYVEETNPDNPNQVRFGDAWEDLDIIEEEILVKGEAPVTVELKFSRHGPIFYEDPENNRAYAVRSVVQEHGTAPYLGSFKLAQATSCQDFHERSMFWMVPTHNLVCADDSGNIAFQITGLTPDRDGWNGRLPVPGTGQYEWVGFRDDLPRELNPERGYKATANDNSHPPGYEGRPVFYHSSEGLDEARITRLNGLLGAGEPLTIEDHMAIQLDAYSLRAENDLPHFQGWTSDDPDIERARAMVADWDAELTAETTAGAIWRRWTSEVDDDVLDDPQSTAAERRAAVEEGLAATLERLTSDWGADWNDWRYGRNNESDLEHTFLDEFDLPSIERPGGFGTVNATGANFRRIVDLSDLDNSVATNAPGQSGQPGSPFYGDARGYLANGEYFPLAWSREAVDQYAQYRLTLAPGG